MKLLRRGSARSTLGSRRTFTTHLQNQPEEQTRNPACQEEEQKGRQADEGNITRQNFWSSLEGFKAHLGAADFVGFDLELSGIHTVPPSNSCQSLPPSSLLQTYQNIKHLAQKFAVFQVGLALFHLDPACNRLLAYPYNFYVFPRNELSLGLPVGTFSCQADALKFLAMHGFDFDVCVQHGMSYLSKTQEAEARVQLANDHHPFRLRNRGCSRSLNNTSDVVFGERLRMDVEKWHSKIGSGSLDLDSHGSDLAADFSSLKSVKKFAIKEFMVPYSGALSNCPSFTLQLENHHQVCVAKLVVEKHFKDLVFTARSDCLSDDASHDITLFFTKSKEHLGIVKSELEQVCGKAKISEAIGFRHIIDALASSRKPLIGHNCALDLAHIHDKFLYPLPSSAGEFSASILAHFPTIIDTKYLMNFVPSLRASWRKKATPLSSVYAYMCTSKEKTVGTARFVGRDFIQLLPRVQIDIMSGFTRYQETDGKLSHEAGYDAYMTGCVFAQICQQLKVNVKDLPPTASPIEEYTNLLHFGNGILDLRTGKLRQPGGEVKHLDLSPVINALFNRA